MCTAYGRQLLQSHITLCVIGFTTRMSQAVFLRVECLRVWCSGELSLSSSCQHVVLHFAHPSA